MASVWNADPMTQVVARVARCTVAVLLPQLQLCTSAMQAHTCPGHATCRTNPTGEGKSADVVPTVAAAAVVVVCAFRRVDQLPVSASARVRRAHRGGVVGGCELPGRAARAHVVYRVNAEASVARVALIVHDAIDVCSKFAVGA